MGNLLRCVGRSGQSVGTGLNIKTLPKHRLWRDCRGLTLVEVMISLAIFGVLVFFVIQVFDFGSLQKRDNDEIARQAGVAEYAATKLATGGVAILEGAYTESTDWPPGGGSDTYAYQFSFLAPPQSNATICAITVAPKNQPFSASDSDNYKLVVLVP